MREAKYDAMKDSFYNENDVFGACQLFRRECFEEVGGYTPIKWGGIDWVAVRTARLKGWQTRSFSEKFFYHHRRWVPPKAIHGRRGLITAERITSLEITRYGKSLGLAFK